MTTPGKTMKKALVLTLLLGSSTTALAVESRPPSGTVTDELVSPAQVEQSVDAALQREVQNARGEGTRLRRELDALKKEYNEWKTVNSHSVELKSTNDRLTSELEAARTEIQVLKGESDKASSRRNLYWFFSGAAVLAFGLILGLALGGAKRRNQGGYRF